MALSKGSRIGSYEIVSAIGAGGMGEVYRARDTKLGRDVAIKVLPDGFAGDAERMVRFEREAKVLASLNHPNIATIHGLEDSGGSHALVMELVEGPTLADRIKQDPIPIQEALPIAKQICEALEYAHERGIIHRDLKPANIKVTADDAVKVLDFGLAKAIEGDSASFDISTSPTISRLATMQGVLLGTAAYMSPEQAKAKPVDRRADIWAFGCVLYEMLVGKAAFQGEAVTDTLASVIKEEPDWSLLPAATPMRVRVLLQRCLQKDPKQRLQWIGDARISIDEVLSGTPDTTTPAVPARGWRQTARWTAAAIVVGIVAVAFLVIAFVFRVAYFHEDIKARSSTLSQILAPPNLSFAFQQPSGAPVLSPDGTKMVFPADDSEGKESLWVRPLDSLDAQKLQGTEGGEFPFWSSDSRQIGFFQHGKLKRIDLEGGPPVTVCAAEGGRGGTWSPKGIIVFAPHVSGAALSQVPESGGTPAAIASHAGVGSDFSNRWPVFLPDGHHFIYLSGNLNTPGNPDLGIYVGAIGSKEAKFLMQADSDALYAPPGDLLFLRGDTLMAVPFDASNQELKGAPVPVAQRVGSPRAYRLGLFSVSQTGLLVYGSASNEGGGQLTWFDLTGKQLGTIGPPGVYFPRISPDGKRLAYMVGSMTSFKGDIWITDIKSGVPTRFTFGRQLNGMPVWSPDGSQIAFAALPVGKSRLAIFVKKSSGAGQPQELYEPKAYGMATPIDWTRNGKYIVISVGPAARKTSIWVLPTFGDRKPFPYLQAQYDAAGGVVSPDGRWIAYVSDESGSDQVYVSPFPSGGGKWQVSQGQGDEPQWNGDGTALYYVAQGDKLMEASVKEIESAVEVGAPREVLHEQFTTLGPPLEAVPSYTVAPSGKSILVDKPQAGASEPLTLVTGWTVALKR